VDGVDDREDLAEEEPFGVLGELRSVLIGEMDRNFKDPTFGQKLVSKTNLHLILY
jgi:hypothetical protein